MTDAISLRPGRRLALNAALGLILLFVAVAFGLGAWARRGRTMTLEQWSVGGRGFGTLFVFLLMAGEIYTTFTFLGASGWAYGKGAPAFYILCYGALAYAGSDSLGCGRSGATPRGTGCTRRLTSSRAATAVEPWAWSWRSWGSPRCCPTSSCS